MFYVISKYRCWCSKPLTVLKLLISKGHCGFKRQNYVHVNILLWYSDVCLW